MDFRFAKTTEQDVAVAADCEVFDVVAAWKLIDLRHKREGWCCLTICHLKCYQHDKN